MYPFRSRHVTSFRAASSSFRCRVPLLNSARSMATCFDVLGFLMANKWWEKLGEFEGKWFGNSGIYIYILYIYMYIICIYILCIIMYKFEIELQRPNMHVFTSASETTRLTNKGQQVVAENWGPAGTADSSVANLTWLAAIQACCSSSHLLTWHGSWYF